MKPILFSKPMVCAILENRKTQTRRVVDLSRVKHRVDWVGWSDWGYVAEEVSAACGDMPAELTDSTRISCPYGAPGDRLWVREEHYRFGHWEPRPGGPYALCPADGHRYNSCRQAFFALIDAIHGEGTAALNPWVWVVEFRRVEAAT